jgi:hypothetical protein
VVDANTLARAVSNSRLLSICWGSRGGVSSCHGVSGMSPHNILELSLTNSFTLEHFWFVVRAHEIACILAVNQGAINMC